MKIVLSSTRLGVDLVTYDTTSASSSQPETGPSLGARIAVQCLSWIGLAVRVDETPIGTIGPFEVMR